MFVLFRAFKASAAVCACLVTLALAPHQLVFAEVDYQAQIKKYVQCEALQNLVASILSENEEDFFQHELHQAANDSHIVAERLTYAGGYQVQLIDELYVTYLREFQSILRERAATNEVSLFVRNVRPQLDNCKQLNAMQADIIRRSKENETAIENPAIFR